MKKKYREITVNGERYAWSSFSVVDECEIPCVRVKIWRDKNTLIFDEVWEHQSVKPATISDKIRILTANAESSHGAKDTD